MKYKLNNFIYPELIEEIYKWQKNTFTKITILGQYHKLKEEYEEYIKSNSLEEMADCFLVMILTNYLPLGKIINYFYLKKINKFILKYKISNEILNKEIKNKFEINKSRKWKLTNNCYKHISF